MSSSAKVHLYKVEMTCQGCANALDKVLQKHKEKGIENFEIDLNSKTVAVTTSALDADQVLEILKKTGKTTTYEGEKK